MNKVKLREEMSMIKSALGNLSSPVVFCHNDLLLGNVVLEEQSDRITFIDWEYAAPNYQAFDIGNHFCEWAGVNPVEYTHYPDKVQQLAWLSVYVRQFHECGPLEQSVPLEQLENMYVIVNKFGLLSHLLWGLWGLVQAQHSTIDFDFLGFAAARLDRYFHTRDEFLAL